MLDGPTAGGNPGGKSTNSAKHRRAMAYIEANLGRSITLDDIASSAAMSRHHFAREFRTATGMTPMRYLWSRRVRMAKAMLLGTDALLVDVSIMCGFSSQSHFTTMFKKATGRTPAVWRSQERYNPEVIRCPVDGRVCPVI